MPDHRSAQGLSRKSGTAESQALLSERDRGAKPYGVPGEVRTHNLPLRRGMLYPIELLGHNAAGMVTSQA
ncbi:hypothetical protein PXNS11_150100 [Stutzerimonas xanthomarina]|nr:hypothetical protein PXNS11_150100 [Stutzerimonas xanthomarina]